MVVAQTKRKRQTKHRGNAAGVVESRGRTGRKPTADEKKGTAKESAKARGAQKTDKRDLPPTWQGAFFRALFAAFMMVALLLLFKISKPPQAAALFPIVLLFYVPISYYSDQWLYRRRQRKKIAGGGGPKAAAR
jgi:hypothetical protein